MTIRRFVAAFTLIALGIGVPGVAGKVSPGGAGASTGGSAAPPTATTQPAVAVRNPVFAGSIEMIGGVTEARMGMSWRLGCPVALKDLRLVTLTHWGFDGRTKVGEIVVHADQAPSVLSMFARLFDVRFPLQQVRLVDEFGGDDSASMAANNTSGFNCRRATGSRRWSDSEHAYGRAIDINPVQNPYVTSSGAVLPAQGEAFVARAVTPGLVAKPGPVVAAFEHAGWKWGGSWSTPDYQHFSVSGH